MPRTPDTVRTARTVQQLEERLRVAKIRRDAAILDRWDVDGVSMSLIAEETGLTRQRVYVIITEGREDMRAG